HIYDSCSVLGHVIPFCHFLTCKVILMSCWIYIIISTITSIFALAIALITSTSLPVGILLVSYVKNQNGIFKVFIHPTLSIIFYNNSCSSGSPSFLICFGK
uniref:Uncharacterized protein n=1 Tax=Naja naja TaxID=35670 RepID=A0A8C6XS43_NAJNA